MLTPKEIRRARRGLSGASRDLLRAFDALRDPSRLRMFMILRERGEVCVTDIANILDVSLPVASRQLKILETAGLTERHRDGQVVCYRLRHESRLVPKLTGLLE